MTILTSPLKIQPTAVGSGCHDPANWNQIRVLVQASKREMSMLEWRKLRGSTWPSLDITMLQAVHKHPCHVQLSCSKTRPRRCLRKSTTCSGRMSPCSTVPSGSVNHSCRLIKVHPPHHHARSNTGVSHHNIAGLILVGVLAWLLPPSTQDTNRHQLY